MDAPSTTERIPPRELEVLHPGIVRLWRLRALCTTLLGAGAIAVLAQAWAGSPAALLAGLGALGLGTALSLSLPPARYRAWGYRIREHDLYLRRGVLWTKTSIVPHTRIQHVDMRTGPLERMLGLARVVVFTAGTTGGALTIPGLTTATAASLRDRLAELGSGGDAL